MTSALYNNFMVRTYFFSVVLIVCALGFVTAWLLRPVERVAIEIRSGQDVLEGIPVYAQFVVRQTIRIESPIMMRAVSIPFYIPQENTRTIIRVYRNQKNIGDWDVEFPSKGVVQKTLLLDHAMLVDGTVEVEFDGGHIASSSADAAPRVFVEKDDNAFPYGNYQIAENVKKGDISLSITETRVRFDFMIDTFRSSPLRAVAYGLGGVQLLMLIGAFSHIFFRSKARTYQGTTQ